MIVLSAALQKLVKFPLFELPGGTSAPQRIERQALRATSITSIQLHLPCGLLQPLRTGSRGFLLSCPFKEHGRSIIAGLDLNRPWLRKGDRLTSLVRQGHVLVSGDGATTEAGEMIGRHLHVDARIAPMAEMRTEMRKRYLGGVIPTRLVLDRFCP